MTFKVILIFDLSQMIVAAKSTKLKYGLLKKL